MTPDQYTVLRWLNELEHDTISQKDLKCLMFTDANNIAALVKRMEGSGLIKRVQHASDLRKKILGTTPKGERLYYRGKKIADSLEQVLLNGFSSEEKDDFIRVLTKTNSYLLNESKET